MAILFFYVKNKQNDNTYLLNIDFMLK